MNARSKISEAVKLLGGPVAAAERLKVGRYQTVQQWVRAGRVPAKYCPEIERELRGAIRCEDLLPDVNWSSLRGTASVASVANLCSDARGTKAQDMA